MRRLYGYLLNERCLDRDVVHAFVHEGFLYEDVPNHNAVFIGTDENGKPRHIQKRSTNPQSDYKGNVTGSDIAYECLQSDTWKHIADAKGYVLINLFSLLHSEMKKAESSLDIQTEQKHLKIMAVGCLAFCCCREKQMGKTFSFDRYTDAVRSAYKPHRDTGNSEEQREVLQKKIASLEKEFGKSISLSLLMCDKEVIEV